MYLRTAKITESFGQVETNKANPPTLIKKGSWSSHDGETEDNVDD